MAQLISRHMIDGVESLRRVKSQLPIGKYLELLHVAAITGELPMLDPWTFAPVMGLDGRPRKSEVPIEDRLKILSKLGDKVVPDAKAADTPNGSVDPAVLLKQDMSKLPREALLAIISQAAHSRDEAIEVEPE